MAENANQNMVSLTQFPGTVHEKLTAVSAYCREHCGTTVLIPAGRYTLEDTRAREVMEEVFAGVYGTNPEPVMFRPEFQFSTGLDLRGCRDVTILAYGAILMINGFMEPVGIRDSERITIRGLTIDHVRKPFSEGVIADATQEWIDVLFPSEYPMKASAPAPRVFSYDEEEGRFAWISIDSSSAEEIEPQKMRYRGSGGKELIGRKVYFTHTFHSRPGILISHSREIKLRDVTINSQPGMGIVGFKSRDIDIRRLHVVPSEGLHMSTNTDATHFASCSGKICVEDSTFSGHGDDAINVHNYYYSISQVQGNVCTLTVEAPTWTHSQEPDIPEAGYVLALVDKATMRPEQTYIIKESVQQGKAAAVRLDHELPEDTTKYLLANLTDLPVLSFRNNYVHNHLARAVLIKTHEALVENCLFECSMGTAIHVAAESWWHEGIPSKNVVIRGNTFLRCSAEWRAGAVLVNVDSPNPTAPDLHDTIVIEDNTVVNSRAAVAFSIANVHHVKLMGNRFEGFEKPYEIIYCGQVELSDEKKKV